MVIGRCWGKRSMAGIIDVTGDSLGGVFSLGLIVSLPLELGVGAVRQCDRTPTDRVSSKLD